MLDSALFMMSTARFESTMPTMGANNTPSQIFVTGVDISSRARLLFSTSIVMSDANFTILRGLPSMSKIGL